MEWVNVTICSHPCRIAKPVADALGVVDGLDTTDDTLLRRVVDLNWQYLAAQQDRIRELARRL